MNFRGWPPFAVQIKPIFTISGFNILGMLQLLLDPVVARLDCSSGVLLLLLLLLYRKRWWRWW
jgi:hypothetical protein